MEHMARRLKRPLITVSCHDDLTASNLVIHPVADDRRVLPMEKRGELLRAPCAPPAQTQRPHQAPA